MEKPRESAVLCVFTMRTSGVCRTYSSTDDSNNMKEYQLWRARMICRGDGRGKHDYLPPAQESLQRTQTRTSRSFVVCSSRSSRANNRFPPHACRRKRSAAEKARWATAALIFPGVFARTPFIIDRRLKRATPPCIRDRCLF